MKVNQVISYSLNELPEKTQQKIIENFRNDDEFHQGSEIVQSMETLIKELSLNVGRWSIGGRGEQVPLKHPYQDDPCYRISDFFNDEDERLLSEVRGFELQQFLISENWHLVNNPHYDFQKKMYNEKHPNYTQKPKFQISIFESCPLTGVCYDEEILDPIRAFLLFPASDYDLEDLLSDVESAILKTYNQELEYWYSEECIREDIENNDYQFTEDGAIF